MKAIINVTNIFPETALEKLAALGEVRANDSGVPPTRDELKKMAGESAAMITYLSDKIDREIIAAGSDLKIIANYAAGYNNIDIEFAKERGVWATNTPGILHETTADLTWALLLGAARQIVPADRFTRENKFKGWGAKLFLGGDVHGKTLGVIGCGEIGRAVARRASGFDMKILYHQRNRLPLDVEKSLRAGFVSLQRLLEESDFISLHTPLTEETRYMIGAEQFAMMKQTAYVINTGRGKVMDDAALVEALKAGRIAGAALDVYENEPELTPGMTELDNLILAPHIGSGSVETRDRMALHVVENVAAALSGKTPPSPAGGAPGGR